MNAQQRNGLGQNGYSSCPPPMPLRRREPIDGPGPRGLPDCYYTSRTLNSTFRYVRFVKKLRMMEEEQRKGLLSKLKEEKDQQISDFFIRCDRKSLINNVARRVDLCMKSYEEDLKLKKNKLLDLLTKEEEANIRMFASQAQAGAESVWNQKMERLQYLLEKRRQEHEEKYKDTPLSKCVHVHPCIQKLRLKEAQDIQLYQMREKEMKQLAEKEVDDMWHQVAMKESEALTARIEQDEIERYRRDLACKEHNDMILDQRQRQRERDRERLKQEQLLIKAKFEADKRKEEQEEDKRREKRLQTAKERAESIAQRKEMMAKQEAEAKLIGDTWDSLTGQGLAEEQAKLDLMKRKEKELDICNKKMIELRDAFANIDKQSDGLLQAEAQRRQDLLDQKRCEYLLWSQKTNADVRKAMVDQINERSGAREELKKKIEEQDEYQRQLFSQQSQLVDFKEAEDAARRKRYQQDLLDQINYNKLLKERARQEELDQIQKRKDAARLYQEEIKNMLCRPFFSEAVHPFMKQMTSGLKMKDKCPCTKPDYCK